MQDLIEREPVVVNDVNSTIVVPHLGITLRVLLGAAVASWSDSLPGERREYDVIYKGASVASVRVKQHSPIQQS